MPSPRRNPLQVHPFSSAQTRTQTGIDLDVSFDVYFADETRAENRPENPKKADETDIDLDVSSDLYFADQTRAQNWLQKTSKANSPATQRPSNSTRLQPNRPSTQQPLNPKAHHSPSTQLLVETLEEKKQDFSWVTEIWSGHVNHGAGCRRSMHHLSEYNNIL